MKFPKDNFEAEFEKAIRVLTTAMPPAEQLSKPTLLHNIRVAIYLYTHGHGRDVCLAGLLHDAVEDTNITSQDLERDFGKGVASFVVANTKDSRFDDLMEKYKDMMKRCTETEGAAIIKAADILDNYWYFSKIEDRKKTDWMITTGQMLMDVLPADFDDPIFEELRAAIA